METTYRLIALSDRNFTGQTAASPELAKLVPGELDRAQRLGLEQTDWADHFGKMRVHRSILIEAEDHPGQWTVGL